MNFSKLRTALVLLVTATLVATGAFAAETQTSDAEQTGVLESSALAGDGTQASPYVISNKEGIAALGEMTANGMTAGVYFELSCDIVLNDPTQFAYTEGYISEAGQGMTAFTAIGTTSAPFEGVFDGNGHYITGLYCSKNENNGFFGTLSGAVVKDVNFDFALVEAMGNAAIVAANVNGESTIENVVVSGSVIGKQQEIASLVGGIAGVVADGSTINNCCSYACVTGSNAFSSNVGGIAGLNNGEIKKCAFGGRAYGCSMYFSSTVGGITGANNGTVSGCISEGTVGGESSSHINECYVGGIAGKNAGVVKQSKNNSDVSVECYSSEDSICAAGGIAGYSLNADVSGCENNGDVTATKSYGAGICGMSVVSEGEHGITNCLNTGDVTAPYGVCGGIVGRMTADGYVTNKNKITSCINTGAVTGATACGIVASVAQASEGGVTAAYCYTSAIYPDVLATTVSDAALTLGTAFEGMEDATVWVFTQGKMPYIAYPDGISKNISTIQAQTTQLTDLATGITSVGVGEVSYSEDVTKTGVYNVIVRYSGNDTTFAPKSVLVAAAIVNKVGEICMMSADTSALAVSDNTLSGTITVTVYIPEGQQLDATCVVNMLNGKSYEGARFAAATVTESGIKTFDVTLESVPATAVPTFNIMIVDSAENMAPVCANLVVEG